VDPTFYLPATSLAAILNGGLLVALTLAIGMKRRKTHISLGSGGDERFARQRRAHGNGVEQIPLALILMALAEIQGAPQGLLWASVALLTTGRFAHAIHFWFDNMPWQLRFYGVVLTSAAEILLLIWLALALI